jgi:hypothetical protein
MSANSLITVVLVALVLAAAALRIAAGPIVQDGRGASLYALGKTGLEPDPLLASVELASSDARPGR